MGGEKGVPHLDNLHQMRVERVGPKFIRVVTHAESLVPPSVWGVPDKKKRTYLLWLDLRNAENKFAKMALVKLFYAVRSIVDKAGLALPKGSAVQGLLYAES